MSYYVAPCVPACVKRINKKASGRFVNLNIALISLHTVCESTECVTEQPMKPQKHQLQEKYNFFLFLRWPKRAHSHCCSSRHYQTRVCVPSSLYIPPEYKMWKRKRKEEYNRPTLQRGWMRPKQLWFACFCFLSFQVRIIYSYDIMNVSLY